MRIVIDLQGAQGESRYRGIGRYSLSFAEAIARHRGEHEVLLALNGLFTESIEPLRARFADILPQKNIRVWYAPGPVSGKDIDNDWRRKTAEFVREAFLASLKPDMVVVTSLFDGLDNDAVTSIGLLSQDVPTATILYDLIPLLYPDSCSKNLATESWYKNKLDQLRRTDLVLTISEHTRLDTVRYTGLPDDVVVNIGTASGPGDNVFSADFEHNLLEQGKNITWQQVAQRTVNTLKSWHDVQKPYDAMACKHASRPKLAYVSPLPPERSGISDYSVALLPELFRYYDIDVIVSQDSVSDTWINEKCKIRDVAWFRRHADLYDRVLYHFGNSQFHQHMVDLLDEIPGVVVLHDFFLSGLVAHMDVFGTVPGYLEKELYDAHGYPSVQERFHAADPAELIHKYPCNIGVLSGAQAVITHSEYSRRLAVNWYGGSDSDNWTVIPLLRTPVYCSDRMQSRLVLKLDTDDFIICSFGLLAPNKLNHRLLDAWLSSDLAKDRKCVLIYVGNNHDGDYGRKLVTSIRASGFSKRIHITGWVDTNTFRHYLAAADIAVQLRTRSRGESSAAVLDCMNYGIPTIVNANGSLADLPDDAVWMLPDDFSDTQLTEAIETLWHDTRLCRKLGKRARKIIHEHHMPSNCAEQYFSAIEMAHQHAAADIPALTREIASIEPYHVKNENLIVFADAIAQSIPPRFACRQLFVDVSELIRHDRKSGIQRVVRNILQEWLKSSPVGIRIEPVYATTWHSYRYARSFTLELLNCPANILNDEPVEYRPGDIFLGLDLLLNVVSVHKNFYQKMRRHGVIVKFVVYDLLCMLMAENFIDGMEDEYRQWLEIVTESDGAVCISQAVADELDAWVKECGRERCRPFTTSWFHLGADMDGLIHHGDISGDISVVIDLLQDRTSFLMSGTLEPRKGHAQTLAAFEQIWSEGVNVTLVIVGKQGWMIEELAKKIRHHPELGTRLFWFDDVNDVELEKVYLTCSCLIASSMGEGFGLPLVEAARYKLPIIARDIPVFREVAGEHVFYFLANEPKGLAQAIKIWLELYQADKHPKSENMSWLTWEQSAKCLFDIIMENTDNSCE